MPAQEHNYKFFSAQGIEATLGLATDARLLAVHIPSAGGTAERKTRNSGRRALFLRVLDELTRRWPSAVVHATRHGRSDNEPTPCGHSLSAGGDAATRSAFDLGGAYRFDVWIETADSTTPEAVATLLGLEPIERSNLKAMWPSGALPEPTPEDNASLAFVQELDAAIRRGGDPSGSGSTKWKDVQSLLASKTSIAPENVIVGYAGDQNNLVGRLRQQFGSATLRVALVPADMTKAMDGYLESIVGGKKKTDARAILVVVNEGGRWRPSKVCACKRPTPDFAKELATLMGCELMGSAHDEQALADELHVPVEWIRDVLWLLEDKKGVVFYGPPGTGKTFMAQRIAEYVQERSALRSTVQLHPSFGYEEFFEGYRPVESDTRDDVARSAVSAPISSNTPSTLLLRKRNGPLRDLVVELNKAENAGLPGIMVLDEMNRGNLPRVFGELYFLLEYRDREVRLMYSPNEQFRLPEELRIIGTMNTADRSIGLLDQALRRRFHFVGLFPLEEPVSGMLRRYLASTYGTSFDWLARMLEAANANLDRNVAIGPSHFMRSDLDEQAVRRIWRHSVLPTIEEHYFGDSERIADFDFDALCPRPANASPDQAT